MDNVRVVDSSNTDAKDLLPGIDRLDALAPAEIKTDFDRFTRLEHDLLDPGHAGPHTVPNATLYAAMQHLQSYLHSTCGLPG